VAGRRTLVEGLKAKPKADRRKELAFVRGEPDTAETEEPKPSKPKAERKERPERTKATKSKPEPKEQREGEEPTPTPAPSATPAYTGRVPLTTRIRSDLATALKRASLERQLANEKPNTVQDILEEALEPWLKDKGYLKD
jgi:hypothetical protein